MWNDAARQTLNYWRQLLRLRRVGASSQKEQYDEPHVRQKTGLIQRMANTRENTTAQPKTDVAEIAIATVGGLAFALILMFLCVVPTASQITSGRDYVVFWATAQQLVHHANPYDPVAMNKIERAAGLAPGYGTMYMRNPPWALPLVLPLGFVGLRLGALIWSSVLLACLLVSAWLIRGMYGSPDNRTHWLAISFSPALLCFFMGQTSLFSLLGLVLFLRLHRGHPFMAGSALWLCALKPHLFLPIGAVLLIWVIASKRYKIAAGAGAAFFVSWGVTLLLEPSAWRDYSNMMRAPEVARQFIPCLSDAMRLWFYPQTVWLQYLPSVLACAWAAAYFWSRRSNWDWMRDGSILMLVSLIVAPYCWIYDQALAIPALLQGAYSTRSRPMLTALAIASSLVMIAVMCNIKITSPFYLWISPVWLAWYLLAKASFLGRPLLKPADSDLAPAASGSAKTIGGAA